jgi:hypothetical protein
MTAVTIRRRVPEMTDITETKQFVTYYRVSTGRQGESGLGLEAQRATVRGSLGSGSLLAEFQEVEGANAMPSDPSQRP